ncbi:MAG: CotH kinase family protein, partial [Clostridia bacterium]|nr:CotH kinase family protein [Clostridia bacterium]
MKYKIIGICVSVAVILISLILPFLVEEENERYHQHREKAIPDACSHADGEFCTHLPLVIIDTDGEIIPGKAVANDDISVVEYTHAPDGGDQIRANISVIDSDEHNNHPKDEAALESLAMINVRGRSSRLYDKSNYAIRLIDENGLNRKCSVMGMDAHHEWALHGPFIDKSLMRNYMWYNIAGEIMDYAPNVRFCEVMLNGEYMGLYVMTETVTAGDNGARLSLEVNSSDNNFSGYVAEIVGINKFRQSLPDLYGDRAETPEYIAQLIAKADPEHPNYKIFAPFSAYSFRTKVAFEIAYPGRRNLTPELMEAIEQDLSDFQKKVYSYDYDDEKHGYRSEIDAESFIDYFLINEFTCNYDTGVLSTFIYRDLDGKFRMCVWDFNSCCDNFEFSFMENQAFQIQGATFYNMMMRDEWFVEQIVKRYWYLREKYLNEDYLETYVDDVVSFLGPAVWRNFEKWGYTFEEAYDTLKPASRNPRSFEEAVEQLKRYYSERIEWMDKNI